MTIEIKKSWKSKEQNLLKKCTGERTPKGEPTAKRKSPLLLDADISKLGRS